MSDDRFGTALLIATALALVAFGVAGFIISVTKQSDYSAPLRTICAQ